MTKAKYIILLTLAKQASIVYRWMPLANGASFDNVPSCEFCSIPLKCAYCPIHDAGTLCCEEWRIAVGALNKSSERNASALAMIARIEAIDVEAWAAHLAEKGVLNV